MEEVVQTIERLQSTFEDLAVRGLRSCGAEQITVLASLHEELDRIGASHLAGRIEAVINAIKKDDRSSAPALMRAQASLRVFERILTLESVSAQLADHESRAGSHQDADDDEDDESDDDDEDDE